MGMIALADFLDRQQIKTRITHLQIEKSLDEEFDELAYFRGKGAKIFCLDFHWHYQSGEVMAFIKRAKKAIPDSTIIVGGLSASFFGKEFLELCPEADFVVRGDCEIPLLQLIKVLLGRRREERFDSIANLTFRRLGRVVENPLTYTITQEIIDSLCYSRFDLINHYEYYLCCGLNLPYPKAGESGGTKYFYYNSGRGCSVNCTFCGGGRVAQKLLSNRRKPLFISHEAVLRDLRRARSFGISNWHTCFDPQPGGDYYPELFSKIGSENMGLNAIFECWSLPNERFLASFKANLGAESVVVISPEVGSEDVRRKNKGFFYSDAELHRSLDEITKRNIRCELYFTAGLPFETSEDVDATAKLISCINNRYPATKVSIFPMEMEPSSPMYLDGERFCVSSQRRSLRDFIAASQGEASAGYRTPYFSEEAIAKAIAGLRHA